MKNKLILGFMIICIFSSTDAFAATTTSSVGIQSGSLSIVSTPSNVVFPEITLNGDWGVSTGSLDHILVSDARGTGDGWNLTVSSTRFQEIGGLGLTLPSGSLIMYAPGGVTPGLEITSPPPTLATGYMAIDASSFKIASAAPNQGLGSYDVLFGANTLEINIPPSVKVIDLFNYPTSATPYSATLTWSLSVGP